MSHTERVLQLVYVACPRYQRKERNRLFKKKVPQQVPRPDSCGYIDDRFMADEEARRERLVSSCYAASMIQKRDDKVYDTQIYLFVDV